MQNLQGALGYIRKILFDSKSKNAKALLKQKLFNLKMSLGKSVVSNVSKLKSMMNQFARTEAQVDEEGAKAILLKSMTLEFGNKAFPFGTLPSQMLGSMIIFLLEEERQLKSSGENIIVNPLCM